MHDKIAVNIIQLKIDELIKNSKLLEIDHPFSTESELIQVINQTREWNKYKVDYSKGQIEDIKNGKKKVLF